MENNTQIKSNKTNGEILEIFGEEDKVMAEIQERVSRGETFGSMEWCFYRDDYDEITDEMEEIFDGNNIASIIVEWNLEVNI